MEEGTCYKYEVIWSGPVSCSVGGSEQLENYCLLRYSRTRAPFADRKPSSQLRAFPYRVVLGIIVIGVGPPKTALLLCGHTKSNNSLWLKQKPMGGIDNDTEGAIQVLQQQ